MFGHKHRTAINQRAKLMGRMVMLLTDGLCTKSYDQFVESYSNPGNEPDETERNARISRFAMRNGLAVRERRTLDFDRGWWRRLRRLHNCAGAG